VRAAAHRVGLDELLGEVVVQALQQVGPLRHKTGDVVSEHTPGPPTWTRGTRPRPALPFLIIRAIQHTHTRTYIQTDLTMPEPVPPAMEWQSTKPSRLSLPSASRSIMSISRSWCASPAWPHARTHTHKHTHTARASGVSHPQTPHPRPAPLGAARAGRTLPVPRGPVVPGAAALAGDEDVLVVVEPSELGRQDRVHHAGLQVHQQRARHVVLVVRLVGVVLW
jgi:hypothetical protein